MFAFSFTGMHKVCVVMLWSAWLPFILQSTRNMEENDNCKLKRNNIMKQAGILLPQITKTVHDTKLKQGTTTARATH